MEMPEGWKILDKITNEPTNRGTCTGWPKKNARKYLDLMKEMAEFIESVAFTEKLMWLDPDKRYANQLLEKFKEWK